MSLKVAFILPSLANKGPIVMVKDLITQLDRSYKFQCTVYYFDPIVELQFSCNVFHVKHPLKQRYDGYDIIHTHLLRPDTIVAWNKKRIGSAKLVSTLHNYMFLKLNWEGYGIVTAFLVRSFWLAMLRRHNKVVCLSHDMKLFFSRFLKQDKLEVIYNGRKVENPEDGTSIPEEELEMIRSLKRSYKLLGTAANLRKVKGIDQIIRLLKINKDVALLVIGDGPEKQHLENLAKEMGVSKRCLFLGYRSNIFDYHPLIDLYVIPSRVEGLPLALLEAAGVGLATVCSDIPVMKETFSPTEVSFFQLDNIEDLDRAVKYGIDNVGNLAKNIKDKYNECYTIQIMAEKYAALYRNCVNSYK